MWYQRTLSEIWSKKTTLPIRVLVGLRQVGKSSFLLKQKEKGRQYVTLDDPAARIIAQEDPKLFFVQHPLPLIIDECQLAPEIFPVIKLVIDSWRLENSTSTDSPLWLSGSSQLLIDQQIKESLAGRVNYFFLHSLSLTELSTAKPELNIPEALLRGGWPALWNLTQLDPHQYYADYVRSAIEKDAVLFGHIEKSEKFLRVVRLLAGRVGNLLNISDIAKDAGVSATTVADWIDIVASLGFVHKLQPYHSNANKRIIKSPKLYFCDTGLAARICGWSAKEPLLVSPYAGALFENMVFCELLKIRDNHCLPWQIFFWRTKDGEEIDFLIDLGNAKYVALEVKLGGANAHRYTPPKSLQKEPLDVTYAIVSVDGELTPWREGVSSLGIKHLERYLIQQTLQK
jgi:uncharacterized protein